jgi:hypothetical protein
MANCLQFCYETSRFPIEARDELSKSEALKVAVLEKSDARSSKAVSEGTKRHQVKRYHA